MAWTKQKYEEYQGRVAKSLEGLEVVSTGACLGCVDCGLPEGDINDMEEEYEIATEPSFSWSPCYVCDSPLGGDRHPAHALMIPAKLIEGEDGTLEQGESVHFTCCTDCLFYIEYGKLDDMSMMEMEMEEEVSPC